jgi:hypothetical protein
MAKRIVNARDPAPHIAAPLDRSVAASIKALARGEAAPEQQQLALKWIVEAASGTYESVYFPESVRQSDFASGKRFVGNQIVGIINMSMSVFDEKK